MAAANAAQDANNAAQAGLNSVGNWATATPDENAAAAQGYSNTVNQPMGYDYGTVATVDTSPPADNGTLTGSPATVSSPVIDNVDTGTLTGSPATVSSPVIDDAAAQAAAAATSAPDTSYLYTDPTPVNTTLPDNSQNDYNQYQRSYDQQQQTAQSDQSSNGDGSGGGDDSSSAPIVLDLTGAGINIQQRAQSNTYFDTTGSGYKSLTAMRTIERNISHHRGSRACASGAGGWGQWPRPNAEVFSGPARCVFDV